MNGLIRELKVGSKLLPKEIVERASNYIVLTGNDMVDYNSIVELELLRQTINDGIANDIGKYNLGEAFKTSLVWTINMRSLQNFLNLRSSKHALWEIRLLAAAVYQALPHAHKFLFTEYMQDTKI